MPDPVPNIYITRYSIWRIPEYMIASFGGFNSWSRKRSDSFISNTVQRIGRLDEP